MAKLQGQKKKALLIMKYLLENTDEDHPVSMKDILSMLENNDVKAERKSIYDDFEMLRLIGVDIEYRKESPAGYFVANRLFETAELKILVDNIQSSRFISERKSNILIGKIESLTSKHIAKTIQSQVYVSDRVKSMNESIFYNVDLINNAIYQKKQISFNYYAWNLKKELVSKKNEKYIVSPVFLNCDGQNYYLVACDSKDLNIKYYRVDKMKNITISEENVKGLEKINNESYAKYSNRLFGMFSGDDIPVKLKVDNSLIGVMIDRFGAGIPVMGQDDKTFETRINVTVSGQFFGWVAGFGNKVKIISPDSVKNQYIKHIKEIHDIYK